MSVYDPHRTRTYSVREADDILGRRGGIQPRLTVEDVILLLLHADPRPIRGRVGLAAQVFLAVTEVLGGLGVEPGIFSWPRRGPRRDDRVRRALEELAFTGNVAVSGGGGRGHGGEISITARGLERAEKQRARLPAPVMDALARKRAEWAEPEAEPGTGLDDPSHGPGTPERQAPTEPGAGRRAGAGTAGPTGSGRQELAPPAGRPPGDSAEECYAAGCALADRGDHGQAVRLFERALLLYPAHAGSRVRRAESLAALEGCGGDAGSRAGAAPPPPQPAQGPAAAPPPRPPGARGAPARKKKRRYPPIPGFPSIVGTALRSAKKGSSVDILTQFELYKDEQLSQSDGIFAQNAIHRLLSDQVYPLILRVSEEWPDPRDFGLYAVQIVMHSREELNDVLVNEDVRLRVLCQLEREGARKGDKVLVKDVREIDSIAEVDRDPDAATISLLRVRGQWFGKFDVIYNRGIAHQKLKRALKFLNDSAREDASLEGRYNSLWSSCELLAESVLLLHNMLKPKSTHESIRKRLEQLLKNHNMPYIEEYVEIAQIRDSLRYGPPHPDRTREAKRKMARLLDKSLEFAFFAMNFLERRQVGIGSDDTPEARIFDPAGSPAP